MRSSHLIDLLRTRLPGNEVEYAVEDALLEAGAVGENNKVSKGLGVTCRVEIEGSRILGCQVATRWSTRWKSIAGSRGSR